MKIKYLPIIFLFLLVAVTGCNQPSKSVSESPLTPSKSEFKDSTSFVKGVKVFIKPLAQMKVIESVTVKNGKHYYFIGGKQYEAKDLQSLD